MLLFQRVRMQTEHTTECQPLKMASSCPSRKWLHPARHLLKNGCHGKRNVEDVFFSNLSALFVSGQQFSQFIQLVRAGLGVKGGGAYSCGHVPQWVLSRHIYAPCRRHMWVSFSACFNGIGICTVAVSFTGVGIHRHLSRVFHFKGKQSLDTNWPEKVKTVLLFLTLGFGFEIWGLWFLNLSSIWHSLVGLLFYQWRAENGWLMVTYLMVLRRILALFMTPLLALQNSGDRMA